jgi:cytosine deaminase
MTSLLLRNVRPYAGPAIDMLIEGGRIARIAKEIAPPAGATVEDGKGDIVIPGLVEAHTHLDKSLWGLRLYKNVVGPRLIDKIDNERLS